MKQGNQETNPSVMSRPLGDPWYDLRSTCCKARTSIADEVLSCLDCKRNFPIDRGVLNLTRPQERKTIDYAFDISVLILTLNEARNISEQLNSASRILDSLDLHYELIIIDGGSHDGTVEEARDCGATVWIQGEPGYGAAFRQGIEACRGEWVLTIDGDGSHDPNFIRNVWLKRLEADLVIASRYAGGFAVMPFYRLLLSRLLNSFFSTLLSMPIRDLSSGYRLYKRAALDEISLEGKDFNIQIEIVVRLALAGARILEVPFFYRPRGYGRSKAGFVRFALSYLASSRRLWGECRSCEEIRPFPFRQLRLLSFQKRREATRTAAVLKILDEERDEILHLGSGPQRLLRYLPGAVGVDSSLVRLRNLSGEHQRLVHAEPPYIPFADSLFRVVIADYHSWLEQEEQLGLIEVRRVLKENGHFLVWSRQELKLEGFHLKQTSSMNSNWRLSVFV